MADLEAGLAAIRRSATDRGAVEMIVRRPSVDEREVLAVGELSAYDGLVGDDWRRRAGVGTRDEGPEFARQITIMNARAIALFAVDRARWPLAGDQLYVDLDLSLDNLPPGSRLQINGVVVEISPEPHTGCGKFAARFGKDALRLVNSPEGRALRLRGLNARVLEPGTVRVGETVSKRSGQSVRNGVPPAGIEPTRRL